MSLYWFSVNRDLPQWELVNKRRTCTPEQNIAFLRDHLLEKKSVWRTAWSTSVVVAHRIVIAFVAELKVSYFWPSRERFAELLRKLENVAKQEPSDAKNICASLG